MQKNLSLLACLLISACCLAQQYPFVHYTPKDGLISNRITHISQDSKGRLYFTSLNGLSVYDGARFTNYTTENGFDINIINCVMEMGEDSLWVVTNTSMMYSLVKGKLKKISFRNEGNLAIDYLLRDDHGIIYAASEQGLYLLQQNGFTKLPFTEVNGRDINSYISLVIPFSHYLLVQRDNSLLKDEEQYKLYVYDTALKKVIAQTQKEKIFSVNRSPDGRIWLSTDKTILSLDTLELEHEKIVFRDLDPVYNGIKNIGNQNIFFDQEGNGWLTDKSSALLKADIHGRITSFTSSSGLSTTDVNQVFQDKEGIIWIATNSAGVDKMVNSNFSFNTNPFDLSAVTFISYAEEQHHLWLYSVSDAKALSISENKPVQYYEVQHADQFGQLYETPEGLFGISAKSIYKLLVSGHTLLPRLIFTDSVANEFIGPLTDRNGNLFLGGKYHLTVVMKGETIYQKKINAFVDYAALDTAGHIWVASRGDELIMYQTRPDDPTNYLEQKLFFTKELSGISPRSFAIDRNNIFWIGTRSNGLYAYQFKNEVLTQLFHLTISSGLSENFVTYLTTDQEKNIWACTPSGLDKISIRNGLPVVENLTRQNNIYQTIREVVFDQDNTAWALFPNGLIKITPETKKATHYHPELMMVMVKAGKDTITEKKTASLTHLQNNLSFYFAAPTYLDEKQVLYTYRLQGKNTTTWSEPSPSAYASFIGLQPGHYALDVKATFPAGKYAEQSIQYNFFIAPPWWQTPWFRFIAGLGVLGLCMIGVRYYYRRKLVLQRLLLEKQQAIEKERTRIATDMHDDLGAGLSRIKFLSQSLSKKTRNDDALKSGLEKITGFSDEMTEKMGEIVWALNEKNDTLADLVAYTRSYAVDYLANHNIECKADSPMHLPATFIPGEIRRNLFLAVKESLHNIVKHSGASHVHFSITLNENIMVVIHDNGKGIDWENQRPYANGLRNIEKRMMEIKGKADFSTDQGTKVFLQVPLSL